MSVSAGVVVANPGSMRWMRPMTSALANAGLLRAYLTPIATSPTPLTNRLPGRLRSITQQLTLRSVPAGVSPSAVCRTGTATELLRVAATRTLGSGWLVDRVHRLAASRFDHAVGARLQSTDRAVLAASKASLHTFRRARQLGIATLLDYPIAHHRFAEPLLQEEARLQPAYASTLQFHALPAALIERIEQELHLADRIFVLSSFQRRTFLECGVDAAKLVYTPLGVELELFRPPSATSALGDAMRVLFAGQITQRKGVSYLIEGFKRAAISHSELTLLGSLSGTQVPWEPHPQIRHVPPVPLYELPGYYQAADVFVLPSLIEGFPQTALQAMASGLPVIVSENTFGTDVVTDGLNGYVIPIRDPDAIADRLRYLHSHPDERRRMGQAARRRAEDFSWERYGHRIVEAVRTLS